MDVGRLAWRTPTGAMLWEIWGRHKLRLLWQGLALAACVCFVYWNRHGAPKGVGEALVPLSFICFLGAYLHLLACFGYIEADARKGQLGFPSRLLLKPVSTARLALVPMLSGGAIIVTTFACWTELVWRPFLGPVPASRLLWHMLWLSTVLVSLFWWMQALAWSLPLFKGRVLLVLLVALVHLSLPLLPPLLAMFAPGWLLARRWLWGIPAVLLLSAVPLAWLGLKLMRQGRWEGPSRSSLLWSRLRSARARVALKRFSSAFRAQFWLEWRGQGLMLPVITGGFAFLFFAVGFVTRKISGEAWQGGDPEMVVIRLVLILPLLASALLAPALAKFDRLHSQRELPVYIAVRPMTNGGFVMAKLVMALATSALTWLVMVALACFWLALLEKGTPFSKVGLVTPYGPVPFMTGCVPVLLLLVVWTWKNLVAGMAAGLTGRPWIAVASAYCKMALLVGLIVLVATAGTNVSFRETLLHWLTGILVVCLAAKLAVSIAAFVWGLRRNAITPRAVGWIIGGWSVGGLFLAGYAGHVCHTLNQPDLWIWAALAGFLVLPLADLAIAPLALAWNRHR